MLNWQNNNTSSLLQILSRWNHKCTVLFWVPMVQSKRVEYYDHFLRNNVSHRDHLFLQGRIQFRKSTEKKIPEPLWFLFICFVLSSENQDELSLRPLPSSQLQSWTYIPPLNSTGLGQHPSSTHLSQDTGSPCTGTTVHGNFKTSRAFFHTAISKWIEISKWTDKNRGIEFFDI